jgi:hypothetical protein
MGGPISLFRRQRVPWPGVFRKAQTMSAAKVCRLVPMADPEAHLEQRSRQPEARSDDVFHVRRRHPGSSAGSFGQLSSAFANTGHRHRRMDRLKSGAKIEDADIKDFGNAVCFRSEVELGPAKLPGGHLFYGPKRLSCVDVEQSEPENS